MRHVATLFAAMHTRNGVVVEDVARLGERGSGDQKRNGGESSMLQLSVSGKGELRAYFRHINSTEWCSVEGQNEGKLSTVVMPKFESGDEIEYFFVLLDGKRVVAKSPEIYRAKNTSGCETNIARHSTSFTIDCGQSVAGIPASNAAAHALGFGTSPTNPSPERP